MSQQLKVFLLCGVIIAAGRLIVILDGPFVILGAAVSVAGFVAIIVWIRRQFQKERPKLPWPPDDSVGS